ncbi:MAG: hypothetical protein DRP01_00630 [Archaeoglobales archaeon]|nr:MAG: hypothetical protein DRP01_00630 [Archaeoglobales archaeon]
MREVVEKEIEEWPEEREIWEETLERIEKAKHVKSIIDIFIDDLEWDLPAFHRQVIRKLKKYCSKSDLRLLLGEAYLRESEWPT